uniref:G-protein coupled receptors family 1 profile domain-containing protein n=1 Tax=Meloidogyne incognita TaxID=6306 RepID=A0A914N0V4_MELIC
MIFGFNYALDHSDIKVYCNPGEQIEGDVLSFAYYFSIVITLVTVFNYIVIGILIKLWQSGDSDFQRLQTQRIYKSLVVILFVIVFFFLAGVFCSQFIIPLMTNDPEMRFLYFRLFAQLITISGAINAPVLYFCSSEYRTALNKEFPWIPKLFKRMPIIYPSSSIVTNVQVVTTIYPRQNPLRNKMVE